MAKYVIARGDTLKEIARRHGMSLRDLYNHPENKAFKSSHQDPNDLFPGDELWVPNDERKEQTDESPVRSVFMSFDREPSRSKRINPLINHGNRHLYQYKVRTGDTLEKIAEMCGCKWQEIAILNWGTEDPDEINWYLENYFVCETKVGGNYIFTSQDDPGILLLPRAIDVVTGRRIRVIRTSRFPVE